MALLVAACGNSKSGNQNALVTPTTGGNTTSVTEVSGADLQKNVPVSAQGVTNSEIHVAVITSKTNLLQGHYGEFAEGIQAYFDYINSQGGIYGRKLKITSNRDDQMLNNEQQVKASLAQDNAFATFVATPLFSGAVDLGNTNPPMPTFIWNINPEMAGHSNIFGTEAALCFNCIGQGLPAMAKSQGFTKVAVLGYGSTASSKDCATSTRDSFTKYPTAKVVFFDNNIQFAQADLSSQVSAMKDAGAQFVMTCIDQKEALVLAKEIAKEHANIVQNLPNGYDAQFVHDNAAVLEGSFIEPRYVPFEKQPQLPELKLVQQWVAQGGYTMRELTVSGWIAALQFVHALKLAGPNFSQKGIIDALNTDTNFTANGLLVPIDWTKQHFDPKKYPQYKGKWNCSSVLKIHNGQFVPVLDQPGKPWVCVGDGTEPTLATPTYQSFAPAG